MVTKYSKSLKTFNIQKLSVSNYWCYLISSATAKMCIHYWKLKKKKRKKVYLLIV